MRLHFSNIGKVARILCWPVLVGVGQLLIVAILSFLFMQGQVSKLKSIYPMETGEQILERANQLDLREPLNTYMESHMIYVILFNVLLLVFFIRQYHKYQVIKKGYPSKQIPLLLLAPISFCLLFHIILVMMGMRYQVNATSYFWMILLSEGLLGPILEEYLFRGIVYHKLKEIYPVKSAMILCTGIFALFHGNLLQIVFALLLGSILIVLYEKYQDIKVVSIFHILVNLTSLLLVPHLQNLHVVLTVAICILCGFTFYSCCCQWKKVKSSI